MKVKVTPIVDDETPLGDQDPPNHVVMVDIQGLRYPVRSALDPSYVHKLARYVDVPELVRDRERLSVHLDRARHGFGIVVQDVEERQHPSSAGQR